MKFSVGDKIKLRNTGEEGVVVEIIQQQYLRVRVNGVVIPAEEADLDFPYLDWFLKDRAEKKALEKKRLKGKTVYIDNIKKDKSEYTGESLFAPGLYLLWQPIYREQDDEDVINRFKIYLFSEWPITLDYLVDISIRSKKVFSFEGSIRFQEKLLLYSLPFDEASDGPLFDFEIRERKADQLSSHFFQIKLARKKMIDRVRQLQDENLALFEVPVFNSLAIKKTSIGDIIIGQRAARITTLGTPKTRLKAKSEIDLHIEKIEKNHRGLNDAQKLRIQLDFFTTYLDLAIADETINPLRVIHGIGQGVLKKEIFSICNQTKAVQDYVYDKVNPGVSLIYFKN